MVLFETLSLLVWRDGRIPREFVESEAAEELATGMPVCSEITTGMPVCSEIATGRPVSSDVMP